MPRNRNVRVAVLGSSVQRAAPSGHSSTRSSPLKRRFVVVGLVLALAGPVHRLVPLDRARPGRGLRRLGAAAVRDRRQPRRAALPRRGELDERPLRRQVAEPALPRGDREAPAAQRRARRRAGSRTPSCASSCATCSSPSFPKDFNEVAAQVLTSPSAFDQSVTISAGAAPGHRPRGRRRHRSGPRRHRLEGVRERVAGDADHRPEQRRPRGRRDEPGRGRDPRPRQRQHLARPRPDRQGQAGRDRRHDHHRRLAGRRQATRRSSRATSRSAPSRASSRTTPTSSRTSRCSRSSTSRRSSRCSS